MTIQPSGNLFYFIYRNAFKKVVVMSVASFGSGLGTSVLVALIQHQLRTPTDRINWWGVSYFGFIVIQLILMVVGSYISTKVSQDIVYDLRKSVVNQFLGNPFQTIENLRDELFSVLTTDIQNIAEGIRKIPGFLTAIGLLIGSMVYLTYMSWMLALVTVAVLSVSLLLIVVPKRLLTRYSRSSRGVWTRLFSNFQTITSGTKELFLNYDRQDLFMRQEFHPNLKQFQDFSIKEQTLRSIAIRTSDYFIFSVLGIGVILISLYQFVSAADFLLFLTTVLFALSQLANVTDLFVNLSKYNTSILHFSRFNTRFDHVPSVPGPSPTIDLAWLTMDRVMFSYSDAETDQVFTLGPISGVFKPGEITFIVGGNGSGKSTLGKMLCGLYLPESGTVTYGDLTLTRDSQKAFHQYFSAIFSDFYVFDRVVESNTDRAIGYIDQLRLSHKVRIDGDRFSTTQLSQGQRKRLALVHALLEDRPCYILDEWASDQDPEFKKFFYEGILPELKQNGKTVIVITHDDQYFDCADQLLFLSDGRLRIGN